MAYPAKELCRDFAIPPVKPLERLKRAIRYLKGTPRLDYVFKRRPVPETLDLNVDTDFAGCRVTRRSTNGGVALRWSHCIRHWSSTQPTIALSSGEAELGGISKGLSQGLGLRSIAADLNIVLKLKLRTDAPAAMGMCRRLGGWHGAPSRHRPPLGSAGNRIRGVILERAPGVENPGDAMTQYLPGPNLQPHLLHGVMRPRGPCGIGPTTFHCSC